MSVIHINRNNFQNEVLQSDKPVLIDFWASWCGPCRMLSPVLEDISNEYAGKVKVCKVNIDEEPELASAFQVSSIPMVALMEKGKLVKTSVGFRPRAQLEAALLDAYRR